MTRPYVVKEKILSNYKIESEDIKKKQQIIRQNRLRTCYSPKLCTERQKEVLTPKTKQVMVEKIPSTDSEIDSDNDIVFWYTAETVPPILNHIKENDEQKERKDTVKNEPVKQNTTIMTTTEDNNASKVQTKETKTTGQNNISEQQSNNRSSTTSNDGKSDNTSLTTEDIFFDTQIIQQQNTEEQAKEKNNAIGMEEDEDIRAWLAIIEDDLSDTSIDNTFKNPDYHLPVIIDRQPTPIPRAMSEQEEPTRIYPSRIHK